MGKGNTPTNRTAAQPYSGGAQMQRRPLQMGGSQMWRRPLQMGGSLGGLAGNLMGRQSQPMNYQSSGLGVTQGLNSLGNIRSGLVQAPSYMNSGGFAGAAQRGDIQTITPMQQSQPLNYQTSGLGSITGLNDPSQIRQNIMQSPAVTGNWEGIQRQAALPNMGSPASNGGLAGMAESGMIATQPINYQNSGLSTITGLNDLSQIQQRLAQSSAMMGGQAQPQPGPREVGARGILSRFLGGKFNARQVR